MRIRWLWYYLPVLLLVIVCSPERGSGQIQQWVLGGKKGSTWPSQSLSIAGLDDRGAPGAIQTAGFQPDVNIVRALTWSYGIPTDFITEGHARLWDNTARRSSILMVVDGDDTTSTADLFKEFGVDQTGRTFFFDFGTRFPVNRIVFFPRQSGEDAGGHPFSDDFIRKFEISFSNGVTYGPGGQPVYSILKDVPFNTETIVDIRFPLQFVRFLRLRVSSSNPFEVAEFQVYGLGFVPKGIYLSKVIDLGALSNFGRLFTAISTFSRGETGLTPSEGRAVRAAIRMRTGKDNGPLTYFRLLDPRTKEEEEISEEQYRTLKVEEQGRIIDDDVNWSPWSPPLRSGEQIPLPSPRRFFQLQFVLESFSVLETIRVDSLAFEYTRPLAEAVVGEISRLNEPTPPRNVVTVASGVPTTFVYDVRAKVNTSDSGFDLLKITTPAQPVFREFLMGIPLEPVDPDSVKTTPNALMIFFPSHRITPQKNLPLRVIFDSRVLTYGTPFLGEISRLTEGVIPQPVEAGNANDAVSTNSLRVLVSQESLGEVLSEIDLSPPRITPNGDGINDAATISYTITILTDPTSIDIGVFTVSGRRIRTIFSGRETSGIYQKSWDGRDEAGHPVPPGMYVCSVSVGAGTGVSKKMVVIAVVY